MMKTLLAAILVTLCAVTAHAQTIKSLGYNTTNGQVLYSGTNTLTFTNANVEFSAASFGNQIQVAPGTAGTPAFRFSTNPVGMYYGSALGVGPFLGVTINSNAIARFATNKVFFEQPIEFPNATNAAITRTNLSLEATWLTNTDATNFRTAIGLGATNDVSFNSVTVTNTALTRTNLGLPLPALTNTNNFNTLKELGIVDSTDALASGLFVDRALVVWDGANDDWGFQATDDEWRTGDSFGDTNAPTNTTNAVLWINVIVGTNAYKLPLYQ